MVFSWGHGGHGQLGHSSIQNQKIPLAIESLADQRVVYIACGGSSSAAVTGKITHHICSKRLPALHLSCIPYSCATHFLPIKCSSCKKRSYWYLSLMERKT